MRRIEPEKHIVERSDVGDVRLSIAVNVACRDLELEGPRPVADGIRRANRDAIRRPRGNRTCPRYNTSAEVDLTLS